MFFLSPLPPLMHAFLTSVSTVDVSPSLRLFPSLWVSLPEAGVGGGGAVWGGGVVEGVWMREGAPWGLGGLGV